MTYILTKNRPLTLLVELFLIELALDNKQIAIASNDRPNMNIEQLHIVLTDLYGEDLGHSSKDIATFQGMEKESILWMRNDIQVDVYSRSAEVIDRKEEIKLALQSYTAEELMDKYECQLQLSGDGHASYEQDGTQMMNRYTFTISAFWHKAISNPIPYYDTFSTREVIG